MACEVVVKLFGWSYAVIHADEYRQGSDWNGLEENPEHNGQIVT